MAPLASPTDDEKHHGACGTALSTASYLWLLGKLDRLALLSSLSVDSESRNRNYGQLRLPQAYEDAATL